MNGTVRLQLVDDECRIVEIAPLDTKNDPQCDDQDMTTLWSGRFDTAPDAAAFDFGASFRFDRRLFEDDVTGSMAWARALGRGGVLPADEVSRIESALGDVARARPIGSGLRDRSRRGRPHASSSVCWSSASATRAGDCTQAGRATSRCRSISGSICGGGFQRCSARSRA